MRPALLVLKKEFVELSALNAALYKKKFFSVQTAASLHALKKHVSMSIL